MGVVDDAVEDGVGDCGLADDVVPSIDRDLAGDEGGAAAVALLDDLEQIAALVGGERPSRMSNLTLPSLFMSLGWRPSPRASARSANSLGRRW